MYGLGLALNIEKMEVIIMYYQGPPVKTDQVARQQHSCHSVLT